MIDMFTGMLDSLAPHNMLEPYLGGWADPLGIGNSLSGMMGGAGGKEKKSSGPVAQSNLIQPGQGFSGNLNPQASRDAGGRVIDFSTTPFISEARLRTQQAYPEDMVAKLAQMLAEQQRMQQTEY